MLFAVWACGFVGGVTAVLLIGVAAEHWATGHDGDTDNDG